ncbi:hypothetical protein DPMN_192243 [Dreissena polymorpha]|uniref:Uncharacterized protein n=1 Tax=Dreissena polymorpha TaxID=45954 RepID=A0A9D3XZR8_DREPO|nr:hypothetical protein DPMN_192243 [Dreissena polymorpha]
MHVKQSHSTITCPVNFSVERRTYVTVKTTNTPPLVQTTDSGSVSGYANVGISTNSESNTSERDFSRKCVALKSQTSVSVMYTTDCDGLRALSKNVRAYGARHDVTCYPGMEKAASTMQGIVMAAGKIYRFEEYNKHGR